MHSLGSGDPPTEIPDVASMDLSYDEVADGELIGQGGNADVFRVTVERGGRETPVAVKQPRLKGTLSTDTVDQFVQEADVWAELDGHEHIVSLYDWGAEPLPWLAMEYMDRGTLANVPDGERLPLEQALWVGVCVCRAVHHAHRFGVAHHDIKPANVLFTSTDDGWAAPKVSDWGLARLMLDETGSVAEFSPGYAAPEQFDAEEYGSPDDRTDIYQVGTLVYELVTGQPPFEGSATAVMQGVLSTEPTPPSEVADVPTGLDDVLGEALAKEPDERYDSVVYLRDRLHELFDEQHGDSPEVNEESSAAVAPTNVQSATDASSQLDESLQTERQSGDTESEGSTTETTEQSDTDGKMQREPRDGDSTDDGGLPFGTGSVRVAAGIVIVAAIAIFGLLAVTGGLPVELGGGGDRGISIDSVELTDRVSEGGQFDVGVTVTNTAENPTTDTVEIDIDNLGTESVQVEVPAETTDTVVSEFETETGDSGEYTVTVDAGNESVEDSIVVVADPPELAVDIVNTTSPVSAGNQLGLTANVTNSGDDDWSGEVVLEDVDGNSTDSTDLSVPAGETEQVELEWATDEGTNVSEDDITVSARSEAFGTIESDTESVEVRSLSEPFFNVTNLNAPTVSAGAELTVIIEVTNEGGESDAQTLTVDAGPLGTNSTQLILGSRESTEETFTFTPENPDEYTITTSTDDSTTETTVRVQESGSVSALDIAGDGPDATIAQGEDAAVELDVTNDGNETSGFEATLKIDGTAEATSSIDELDSGETGTVSLVIPTDLDLGTYEIAVSVAGETKTGTLEVSEESQSSLSGLDIAGQGDDATVTLPTAEDIGVTVENVGGLPGEFDVTLAVGDAVEETERDIELDAGSTETVTFEGVTDSLGEGEYNVIVSTNDGDSVSGSLTVEQLEGPTFVFSEFSVPDSILKGEQATASATIENIGDVEGTQDITFEVSTDPARPDDETTLTLGSGESDTVELSVSVDEVGTHGFDLETDNETQEGTVTVNEESEQSNFNVEISTTSPVEEGQTLEVTAVIENTGDEGDSQTVALDVLALGSDSTSVNLESGQSTTETLSVGTESGDAGNYNAIVSTDDDEAGRVVTVEEPPEQATFQVSIDSTTSPVEEGETLEVTAVIENTGDESDSQTVALDVGALGSDSTSVNLEGGQSTTETLSVGTESGDAGNYNATVLTDNDFVSRVVTVEEPPEQATFQVSIDSTTSPVEEGETLEVTAVIENTGDESDSQPVALDVGALGSDSTSVNLEGGQSTTETLSVGTESGDAGNYNATVLTDNDFVSRVVTVEEPPEQATFQVSIDSTTSPVEEGETLEVTAVIENTGDESDSQTVALDVGALGSDSTSVNLEGGQSTTETLSVGTESGDAGNYNATVLTDNDFVSRVVTVEEPPEQATFQVSIDSTTSPVEEGETLEVTAVIENTGDESDSQTVALDVGALGSDSTSVNLEGGQSTTETLSVGTESGDAGNYNATVLTDNDFVSRVVTVEEPPEQATFQVSVDSTTSPVEEGETLEVTAVVENTGDESDSQPVVLGVDGLSDSDSTRAEFPPGQYNLPRCHNQADTGASQRHNPVL